MKILCIIQAYTGSKRLPKKVLLPLEDKTVLEHIVLRVKRAKLVDEVVVATTTRKEDDKIAALCRKSNFKVFRGSLDDVLERYYQAALLYRPKHVVRITSDCPLIDALVIDKVIKTHLKEKADYTGTDEKSFPDGEDTETLTFQALEHSWKNAKLASEREHVTLYIKNHPEKFKWMIVKNQIDLSKKRWTLDEREDYEFIKVVYKNLYPKDPYFGMKETLTFLEKHKELEKINSHIGRNEGLAKSLKEDRIVK